MRVRSIGLALAALSLVGCKSLKEGAAEIFSSAFTCPQDRVEVRARPDLKPSTLRLPQASPSPEIAADPGRLALWNKERQKSADFYDKRYETFEARGCDHEALYTCRHPDVNRGSGTRLDVVSCGKEDAPPGSKLPW